jgi:hypothetical protein
MGFLENMKYEIGNMKKDKISGKFNAGWLFLQTNGRFFCGAFTGEATF